MSTCARWTVGHVPFHADSGARREILHGLIERVRATGMDFFRASWWDHKGVYIVEGWPEQPADQGSNEPEALPLERQI